MQSRDFCYWLQGFFELSGAEATSLTVGQAAMIRRHLDMVFAHEIEAEPGAVQAREKVVTPAPPVPPPAPEPRPEPAPRPEPEREPSPPLPMPMC